MRRPNHPTSSAHILAIELSLFDVDNLIDLNRLQTPLHANGIADAGSYLRARRLHRVRAGRNDAPEVSARISSEVNAEMSVVVLTLGGRP